MNSVVIAVAINLVCKALSATHDLLKARLARGVAEGEIPASIDIHALARVVQTVQNGMSILARDEVEQDELVEAAKLAMLAWDAWLSA